MGAFEAISSPPDSVLIALTGPPNAGASTVARNWFSMRPGEMCAYDPDIAEHFTETQVYQTRNLLFADGWQPEPGVTPHSAEYRHGLQEHHYFARLNHRGHEIWDRVLRLPHVISVVDPVRNVNDALYLKQRGVVLVAVECELDTAAKRFIDHEEDERHPGEKQSPLRRATWDLVVVEFVPENPKDPYASDIPGVMSMADYTIDGNMPIRDMLAQGQDVFADIAHSHVSQRAVV